MVQRVQDLRIQLPSSAHAAWTISKPQIQAGEHRHALGVQLIDAAGRVTERYTRRDVGHMDIDITIDDPKAYAKPWHAKVPVNLLADSDLIETVCENEKDIHLMDRASKPVDGRR